MRAAVLQQARRVVDERGGGSDEQEQEVEDSHGVLVLCGALCGALCAPYDRAHAVQAPWRQLAMCSVCKLARVAETALAVFSKYDRCAAAPTLSLVEKLDLQPRSEQIKCLPKSKSTKTHLWAVSLL